MYICKKLLVFSKDSVIHRHVLQSGLQRLLHFQHQLTPTFLNIYLMFYSLLTCMCICGRSVMLCAHECRLPGGQKRKVDPLGVGARN